MRWLSESASSEISLLPATGQPLVEPPGVDGVGGLAQVVDQPEDPDHRGLHEQHHDQHRGDGEHRHRSTDGVDDALLGGRRVRDVEHAGLAAREA